MGDEWMNMAACREADVDVWFPGPRERRKVAQARRVCAGCPVRVECLQWALALEEGRPEHWRFGVFAGTTPRQRVALDGGAVS